MGKKLKLTYQGDWGKGRVEVDLMIAGGVSDEDGGYQMKTGVIRYRKRLRV